MRLPAKPVKKSEGFTIIEVLIVLAIAGLIMVVVFMAVPALNRSGRNNALDGSVHNILTGIGNYVNNNNGNMPPVTGIEITDNGASVTIEGGGSTNSEKVSIDSSIVSLEATKTGAAITREDPVGTAQVILGSRARCNATASGIEGTATGRSYVVLYVAEGGDGSILKCVGA
jgi:prepilin-type N-terminal cleavage/methylation domain-containing protein